MEWHDDLHLLYEDDPLAQGSYEGAFTGMLARRTGRQLRRAQHQNHVTGFCDGVNPRSRTSELRVGGPSLTSFTAPSLLGALCLVGFLQTKSAAGVMKSRAAPPLMLTCTVPR